MKTNVLREAYFRRVKAEQSVCSRFENTPYNPAECVCTKATLNSRDCVGT